MTAKPEQASKPLQDVSNTTKDVVGPDVQPTPSASLVDEPTAPCSSPPAGDDKDAQLTMSDVDESGAGPTKEPLSDGFAQVSEVVQEELVQQEMANDEDAKAVEEVLASEEGIHTLAGDDAPGTEVPDDIQSKPLDTAVIDQPVEESSLDEDDQKQAATDSEPVTEPERFEYEPLINDPVEILETETNETPVDDEEVKDSTEMEQQAVIEARGPSEAAPQVDWTETAAEAEGWTDDMAASGHKQNAVGPVKDDWTSAQDSGEATEALDLVASTEAINGAASVEESAKPESGARDSPVPDAGLVEQPMEKEQVATTEGEQCVESMAVQDVMPSAADETKVEIEVSPEPMASDAYLADDESVKETLETALDPIVDVAAESNANDQKAAQPTEPTDADVQAAAKTDEEEQADLDDEDEEGDASEEEDDEDDEPTEQPEEEEEDDEPLLELKNVTAMTRVLIPEDQLKNQPAKKWSWPTGLASSLTAAANSAVVNLSPTKAIHKETVSDKIDVPEGEQVDDKEGPSTVEEGAKAPVSPGAGTAVDAAGKPSSPTPPARTTSSSSSTRAPSRTTSTASSSGKKKLTDIEKARMYAASVLLETELYSRGEEEQDKPTGLMSRFLKR